MISGLGIYFCGSMCKALDLVPCTAKMNINEQSGYLWDMTAIPSTTRNETEGLLQVQGQLGQLSEPHSMNLRINIIKRARNVA